MNIKFEIVAPRIKCAVASACLFDLHFLDVIIFFPKQCGHIEGFLR